ncbi:MAG TPA: CDP-glucose 4,6-dehydratase [Burkholderiaceae bacterium]|nr:CDP-glucose 4,6-dehydratase [Burkholderiaceae bacterium]
MDLSDAFSRCYAGRRVLVTGHTGFKGSWLAMWLECLGAQVIGLALPADSEPSHHAILGLAQEEYLVDLRDARAVRQAVTGSAPEVVFHLAAQPLVRRGYREPALTFETNVQGTVNLLEAVRSTRSVRAVVVVTTDKCYQPNEGPWGYRESDPLGGPDPYSASKACAELVTASYRASFMNADDGRGHRVLMASARAGNVIGGGDWAADRLVPDLVRAALSGVPVPIRYPHAVRPWQHVLEPLGGYLLLGQRLLEGAADCAQAWNFGPAMGDAWPVSRVVETFSREWPQAAARYQTDPSGPHEATALRLDCAKAELALDWQPVWRLDQALMRTARWYRGWHGAGEVSSMDDLTGYLTEARRLGRAWAAPFASAPASLAATVFEAA